MAAKPFESRIQDLVYNVEVGFGLVAIKVFLYVLAVISVMGLYIANQFKGFREAEAMEYAQLGREWARTGTLTTLTVRPSTMWYLMKHNEKPGSPLNRNPRIMNHPDILHAPMYAWYNGTLQKGFGVTHSGPSLMVSGNYKSETIIVVFNSLLVVFGGLFLYFTARRLFDSRVAFITVTTFYLSNVFWASAIRGLPDTLALLFVLIAMYAAVTAVANRQEERGVISWLLPSLICAVFSLALVLTRYPGAVLVPGFFLYLGFGLRKRGWLVASAYLLIVLLGTVPWLIRNKQVSGSLFGMTPYTALHQSALFADQRMDRSLAIDISSESRGDKLGAALRTKWMSNLKGNLDRLFGGIGHGIVPALFIVTFLYRFVRQPVHSLRWCMAVSMFLLVIVAGFFGPRTMDLLLLFTPMAIMFATAFFFLMLERLNLEVQLLNNLATTGFVSLATLPMVITLMPPQPDKPYPPYNPQFVFHIAPMLAEDELMCSDMPWATAWYGDRKSLLIPSTLEEFYEIHDTLKWVSGLYVTTLTRNQRWISDLQTGPDRTWFPIHQARLGDFPLREGFQLGNLDQMFFTDRKRWPD